MTLSPVLPADPLFFVFFCFCLFVFCFKQEKKGEAGVGKWTRLLAAVPGPLASWLCLTLSRTRAHVHLFSPPSASSPHVDGLGAQLSWRREGHRESSQNPPPSGFELPPVAAVTN